MTAELKKAIKELDEAGEKYMKLRGKQKPDNTDLYCKIVGPAWDKYLAAGGSLTMLND